MARDNRDDVVVTPSELRDGDRFPTLPRRVVGAPRELPGGRRIAVDVVWPNGRRETIQPEAHRMLRVRRTVVGAGKPLRHRAKSRVTGGLVEVYDTAHADTPVPAREVKGHRWAMRCEHGTLAGRRTLGDAVDDVSDPRLWCLRCVEVFPGARPLF